METTGLVMTLESSGGGELSEVDQYRVVRLQNPRTT